jgi:ATP-dependent DNA helicase DinG
MARAVSDSLDSGRHLAVEAPTGVGKSLAYLVPAALWAAREQRKVVVATYTRALQEQLTQKDLPLVQSALAELGVRLEFSLLMGSENYLCLHRLSKALRQPLLAERADWAALTDWSETAATGLRSRLPFSLGDAEWDRVSRDPDLCPGKRGPFWDRCLYRKDLAAARSAHIVVVNQHLLFAGLPIPSYDALIIDEAHNAEETAARFLGFSLGEFQLKRLLDEIDRSPAAQEQAKACRAATALFFRSLCEKLSLTPGPEETASRRVREPLDADAVIASLSELAETLGSAAPATLDDELELHAWSDRCRAAAATIKEFAKAEGSGWAYWADARRTRRGLAVSIHRAPVDVAPALRESLFGAGRPVILTSATLAVGGSFSHLESRLGLDEPLELKLDSPFDFSRQAALYVAESMPDPKTEPEAYERAVVDRCGEIVRLTKGGVFLLFTSRQLMVRAHAELGPTMTRPVYRQGEAAPWELLERFRKAGDGVLFGTDTFWQGVDIAGPALSCVVITRLPFLSPDSPLEEARHEWLQSRGDDVFREYTLPKAVIRFRQGFGRLIRTGTDRGAVVVLDPRLLSRSYGKIFRSSLPGPAPLDSLEQLAAFLKGP